MVTFPRRFVGNKCVVGPIEEFQLADAAFRVAKQLGSADARIEAWRALIAGSTKRWANAVELCDRALRLTPHNAAGYYCKAVALGNLSRFEDAIVAATSANELARSDEYLYGIAFWLNKMGKSQRAMDTIDTILERGPASKCVYQLREVLLAKAAGTPG